MTAQDSNLDCLASKASVLPLDDRSIMNHCVSEILVEGAGFAPTFLGSEPNALTSRRSPNAEEVGFEPTSSD